MLGVLGRPITLGMSGNFSKQFPANLPGIVKLVGRNYLHPAASVSRASAKTFMDSNGTIQSVGNNLPAFAHEYNAVTGMWEYVGLSVHQSGGNVNTWSRDFGSGHGYYFSNTTSTTTASLSKRGGLFSTLTVTNTSNPQMFKIYAGAKTRTFSAILKAGNIGAIGIYAYNITDGSRGTSFNLTTGTVTSGTGKIKALGNGEFLCSLTSTSTVNDNFVLLFPAGTPIGSSILFADWQVTESSIEEPYAPTEGSAIVRLADNISIATANIPGFVQGEGAILARFFNNNIAGTITSSELLFSLSDGTAANRIRLFLRPTGADDNHYLNLTKAGSDSWINVATGSERNGMSAKVVSSWSSSLGKIKVTGDALRQVSSTNAPQTGIITLSVGAYQNYSHANGNITEMWYLPRYTTDAEDTRYAP